MIDPGFFETFSVSTVTTALVTGLMFGLLGFVPLVRRMTPGTPPPPTARQALWGTTAIVFIILGSVVTVFYGEQVVTEIVLGIASGAADPHLWWRAVGRYGAFLVFLASFSFGVGLSVWNEYRSKPPH